MKSKLLYLSVIATLPMILHAAADTIYSGLLDAAIPTDFTGITVNINGGTINPFFGGVDVANNNLLQPFRTGTGSLDTLLKFGVGDTLDASDLYLSTGFGGSQNHVGTTFIANQEGYLGFKLNGTDYGWMRVVFTNNTGGAVIKDWAYDNSGAAIVTGRVNQSATVSSAQTVTLSPDSGESFSLGSLVSNTNSNTNSVFKTGSGTTILTQANTYTGTTTVSAGTLGINGNQSTASGTVSVESGATLMGKGTVGGATTIKTGAFHNAGDQSATSHVGTQTFGGNLTYESQSIFAWDLAGEHETSGGTRGVDYDAVNVGGALSVHVEDTDTDGAGPDTVTPTPASDTIFRVLVASGFDFSTTWWDQAREWSDIFTVTGTTSAWAPGTDVGVYSYDFASDTYSSIATTGQGYFTMNGTTLNWSAVPEPTSALAGLMLGAGLLRRRRARGVATESASTHE